MSYQLHDSRWAVELQVPHVVQRQRREGLTGRNEQAVDEGVRFTSHGRLIPHTTVDRGDEHVNAHACKVTAAPA